VLAQRDECVLQARALERVRMDVARRHARDAEPLRERLEAAVERPVVAVERALQLDAERIAAEDPQQAAHRRLVAHAVARAAAEADEARGVRLEVGEVDRGATEDPAARMLARVRVRTREEPAEVRPAGRVADQERDVAAVVERHFRPVDRAQAQRPGGLRELHRARDGVMVGERQRGMAALQRGGDELLRMRRAVEEGEGRVGVKLDVGHTNRCSHAWRMDGTTGSNAAVSR
jgi:hypothetical protein